VRFLYENLGEEWKWYKKRNPPIVLKMNTFKKHFGQKKTWFFNVGKP